MSDTDKMTDVDKQIAELRLGNDSGGNRDCDWRMKLRAAATIQSLKDENELLEEVVDALLVVKGAQKSYEPIDSVGGWIHVETALAKLKNK